MITFFTSRYELPICFIVMNNNGIYSGLDQESWSDIDREDGQLGIRYVHVHVHVYSAALSLLESCLVMFLTMLTVNTCSYMSVMDYLLRYLCIKDY